MPGTRARFLVLICALAALCCGSGPEPLNVLIIAIDTLRADHLGCYGYSRNTSPNIDKLAAGGVLCERCTSQAPWTLPSFATAFTSLYPAQHGAETVRSKLRESVPTLAGILKGHGYATGAVINAPALKPAYRVNRGFDHYHMTPEEGRVADGTTRDALEWLDTVGDDPFFAFVHYFDPHLSYSPPAPHDKVFTVDYDGPIGYSFNLEGFSRVRDSMFVQMQSLEPADWHRIVALYDGEIAFTDAAVADLLRGLEERDLRDNTLIILMSDHGEEFFEHGGFEHGHTLYEELINVPLLFSLAGRLPEGARLARPVRVLDLAPTILDFLAIEEPAHFEGVSIRSLLEGEGESGRAGTILPPGVAYAEAIQHGRQKKCVTAYPWKLVYELGTEEKWLHNLAEDPGEMQDVLADRPEDVARLENLLFQALFGTSDTWYVELAGGDAVGLEVIAEKGPMPGNISPYRILGDDGRILNVPGAVTVERSGSRLRIEGLDFKGPLTLAFRAHPPNVPVAFDFKIDGRSAPGRAFLGQNLQPAEEMPVTIKAKRAKVKSPQRPELRSDPPYLLVWYEESLYRGDTTFDLDEETKRELRSLGYIQ
jgi:arylsulfatase A-like enzyme